MTTPQTHLRIFSAWWMHPCIPPRIQIHLRSVHDLGRFCYQRSTSVPTTPKTVKRMAMRYMPVTETVTPPISHARASAMDPQMDPDTPPPTQKSGRSRGRCKWRAPQSANPGVGTRSKTRQAELNLAEATQAQASRAAWPPRSDHTAQIQRMTRELQITDRPQDAHREMQRILPIHKVDQNQNVIRPPAAGIHTQQQDVFFIPPLRAGGGALGASTPVSTATLGLIHRADPSLAAQLHLLRHNCARTQPLWPYTRCALGCIPRCA